MSSKRLLLVEDSEFMTERVSATLQSEHSFAVASVSSVAEAKERITADGAAFDCVVSNYDLPDGTGVDLAAWIREDAPGGLPFVLLSGNSFDAIAPEALDAGVTAFVSKTNDVSESMDLFANRVRLAIRAAE